MADENHLSLINKGAEVWNDWVEKNPDVVPDLFQADLRGKQLSKFNLQKANLKEAKLQSCNLNNAVLSDAKLRKAKLQETNLQRANFENADLREVNFFEANLQFANLQNADLRGALFSEEVLFTQANLKGTNLTGATGLTAGQIESAITDKTTQLPDYLDEEMEDGFLLQM
ncbi:MAG: pentapeptide repeat-containing protein [Nitrospinae bacterium]|nr:pentapeptide repeat-containing protein [Nitrospinota bacterium]MDA1108704.1 pentapeptide repeat-containing protein [Nitrospinota bacterium]